MGKTKRKLKTETMTDDCFFNPDACAVEEPAAEEKPPKDEGMMDEGMESDDDMEKEMDMMPQITFLMTALAATGVSALDLFWRKHAVLTEQTINSDGDTEDHPMWFADEVNLVAREAGYENMWWAMGSKINSYAMLVLGGAKFVTQLLSMLGIMGSVNIMVWHYGMMVGDLVMLATGIMMFMSYNKAYSIATENASELAAGGDEATDFAEAMGLVEAMEYDMVHNMIGQTAMHLELMANYEGWLWGQVMMLPEEEQEAWMEKMDKDDDMDGDDKHDDDDHMDLFAFWRI